MDSAIQVERGMMIGQKEMVEGCMIGVALDVPYQSIYYIPFAASYEVRPLAVYMFSHSDQHISQTKFVW